MQVRIICLKGGEEGCMAGFINNFASVPWNNKTNDNRFGDVADIL